MAKQLKVTINSITVHNNGEPLNKGELYWQFEIDGNLASQVSVNNPRKTRDGEVVLINESRVVTKDPRDILSISGSVSEKDWPTADESVTFSEEFTSGENWGIGTHDVPRVDGKLNVTLRYTIADA